MSRDQKVEWLCGEKQVVIRDYPTKFNCNTTIGSEDALVFSNFFKNIWYFWRCPFKKLYILIVMWPKDKKKINRIVWVIASHRKWPSHQILLSYHYWKWSCISAINLFSKIFDFSGTVPLKKVDHTTKFKGDVIVRTEGSVFLKTYSSF